MIQFDYKEYKEYIKKTGKALNTISEKIISTIAKVGNLDFNTIHSKTPINYTVNETPDDEIDMPFTCKINISSNIEMPTYSMDIPPICTVDENNPLFSPDTDNLIGLWNNDVHRRDKQRSRFKEADTIKILKYYSDTQTAYVEGEYENIYQTSLNSCTCKDFYYNQMPCKHIYRLAIEAELIKEVEDLMCIPDELKERVNDIQTMINKFPLYVQSTIKNFQGNPDAQYILEKNNHQKKLINLGLIQEVANVKNVVDYVNTKDQIYIALKESTCRIKKPSQSLRKGQLIDWIIENDPETLKYLTKGCSCLELTPKFKEFIKYLIIDVY